jgi:hypothetical protein
LAWRNLRDHACISKVNASEAELRRGGEMA